MSGHDYDYIIIGSGFGGSVSALRLAEKGYRVAVLERGKRFAATDFPKRNWNLRKFLWAPKAFCYGIQAITFLRDVMILHGSGVGGGSLVYANTLLVPPDEIFENPRWRHLGSWKSDLAPHYRTAKQMLGVTEARGQGPADHMLERIAKDMGRGDTYHHTEVGVYFGEPGETVDDPYFDGAGPPRTGCIMCGGCMTGCRHNAKNTLDKNYLYLAEQLGVTVIPETNVDDIFALDGGGYRVSTSRITDFVFKQRRELTSDGVVVSAGVLGTVPLLFKCRDRGSLPHISKTLGTYVRTNSEALVAATSRRSDVDHSTGIAIASGFNPDDDTHIEMVRYGAGHDAMAMLGTVLTGAGRLPRWMYWLATLVRHPLKALRHVMPFGWAKRTGVLLAMQPLPNFMSLGMRRRWWWPFGKSLHSSWSTGDPVPKYFPVANDVAERFAKLIDGDARGVLPEAILGLTSTAHILGGCPIGQSTDDGVIDKFGRVFGHDNLYVADGSIIPVNLSVNPSLTITALTEWVMSHVPSKHRQ